LVGHGVVEPGEREFDDATVLRELQPEEADFLTSQPNISTNWNAGSGNVWLVPVGGGVARIFKLGA
jgi:hypothetical protein